MPRASSSWPRCRVRSARQTSLQPARPARTRSVEFNCSATSTSAGLRFARQAAALAHLIAQVDGVGRRPAHPASRRRTPPRMAMAPAARAHRASRSPRNRRRAAACTTGCSPHLPHRTPASRAHRARAARARCRADARGAPARAAPGFLFGAFGLGVAEPRHGSQFGDRSAPVRRATARRRSLPAPLAPRRRAGQHERRGLGRTPPAAAGGRRLAALLVAPGVR